MAERRFTLIFYLALVIAAFATYGVYRVLEATRQNGRIRTRPVVIALADLPEGSQIDKADVTTSEWPEQTIPSGAFASPDEAVGRVTRVAVFKGEPLVPGRLAPKGTGPGLEVKIAPGKRAMAVRINDVAGLNGLVQPGSRVDMLVTLRDAGSRDAGVAKLFMENLKVLSVGSKVTRSDDNAPINATTATLEVTPSEAEQVALAMKEGNIQLVLRGYGDPDSVTTRGATEGDVLARLRDPQLVAALRLHEDSLAEASAKRSAEQRTRLARAAERPKPAATVPAAAPSLAAGPVKPDSVAIRVYRGANVTQTKFEKDTTAGRRPASP